MAHRSIALASLLLLLSCHEQQPSTTSSSSTASEPPAIATSAVAVEPEITIDSVTATNPIIVKGRARTFENAVSLRLRNSRGELLSEVHVTSVGEMGQHNPYEAQLSVASDPGPRITVEAFEYSAKDGSVRSLTAKTIPYAMPRVNTPSAETRDEVIAYVRRAATLVEQKGAGACQNLSSSAWFNNDWYVFVLDADGRTVCHPAKPANVGRPSHDLIDASGKRFGDEFMSVAKRGGGWVDYLWPKPQSTTPEPKSSYVMPVTALDGKLYVIGSGGHTLPAQSTSSSPPSS